VASIRRGVEGETLLLREVLLHPLHVRGKASHPENFLEGELSECILLGRDLLGKPFLIRGRVDVAGWAVMAEHAKSSGGFIRLTNRV